ncbi:MAG: purine-nucleoside phosphorylase [Clostridia bacterium]
MTPHNEAKLDDIANIVLMPGDPLRAKYIADNFLEDVQLVNSVRNMFGYTGNYKGKRITVFASGMGMPSMGIYSYELYKFYNVDTIIRIGSCGAYTESLNLLDTILVDNAYTEGNYAYELTEEECHLMNSDKQVNSVIENTAKELNIPYVKGNTLCSDCFDYYVKDVNQLIARFPKDLNIIGAEMEAFALFYNAHRLGKKASCLLSVVDSHYKHQEISANERQTSLNSMIELALESAIRL